MIQTAATIACDCPNCCNDCMPHQLFVWKKGIYHALLPPNFIYAQQAQQHGTRPDTVLPFLLWTLHARGDKKHSASQGRHTFWQHNLMLINCETAMTHMWLLCLSR